MRDPEASDFCYYPFFQVLVTAEGKYRPCSKHVDHITHKGKVITTADATLEEAWNSDYMTTMREYFHANKQFPGCAECWRLQKIGLKSMRYDSYQYNIPESQVENPEKPYRIELNSSNVCNLRCRICFATASTQWLTEAKKLYGYDENLHINLSTENLEQVKAWAENLHELCLFGGEPLILPGNIELLDYLIEKDYAKDIALLFNTNGTVFSEEISDRLKQFRRVRISFSIDDIGKRFEFQRTGADWDEVEANLKSAYALFNSPGYEHIEMKICCTVSMFNAYYLPEFFEYFGREFPGLKIFFNYLFNPTRMCVQILPDEEKQVVVDRIRSIRPNFDLKGEDGKLIENIITYIEYREKRPFSEFFRIVNRHDVFRKESYMEVFPEFWNLIKKHKPDDLSMGTYEPVDVQALEQYDCRPDSEAFRSNFDARVKELKEMRNCEDSTISEFTDDEILTLAAFKVFDSGKQHFEYDKKRIRLLDSYKQFLEVKYHVNSDKEGPEYYLYMIGLSLKADTDERDEESLAYLTTQLASLQNGLWKDRPWKGMEKVIDISRDNFLSALDGNDCLPIESEKMTAPPVAAQFRDDAHIEEIVSMLRNRYANSGTNELRDQLVALSLFESRKKYYVKDQLPELFTHCYEAAAGPQNGHFQTISGIGTVYLKSLLNSIGILYQAEGNVEQAIRNLEWLIDFAESQEEAPDLFFFDIMNTRRSDLLDVFNGEDTDQIKGRITDQYAVTV